MSNKPKIGIVGGGAVGLAYAFFLADAAEVIVKTRSQSQADSICRNGLHITRSGIESGVKKVNASADIAKLVACDIIIVAVKSYDTEVVAKELSNIVTPATVVVSLQNGIQAIDILKLHLPNSERVVSGVTYIGVKRTNDHSVSLGKFTRTVLDEGASLLTNLLQETPYGAEISADIRQAVWDKMVLNTGQNALSAVTDLSVRNMLHSEKCLEIAKHLLDEFEKVANAEGLSFDSSPIDRLVANWKNGDDFHPSMWQDLQKGNKTEIDAINGAISDLGEKNMIATPYNDMITALIKILESDTSNAVKVDKNRVLL